MLCLVRFFVYFKFTNVEIQNSSELVQCTLHETNLFTNTFTINTTALIKVPVVSIGWKPFSIREWFFLTHSNKIRMTIKLTCQHRDCPRGASEVTLHCDKLTTPTVKGHLFSASAIHYVPSYAPPCVTLVYRSVTNLWKNSGKKKRNTLKRNYYLTMYIVNSKCTVYYYRCIEYYYHTIHT